MNNNKCNYTGEKIYSAASYYYGAMPGVQFTWRMTFYMDEEIDKNALRVALDKCQKRYP